MKCMSNRVYHILWKSDMEATRFSLAMAGMIWAMLLWWPETLFTPTRTTYRIMSEWATEFQWGMAFFVQAFVMFWALFRQRTSKVVWMADGLLGCVLWTAATAACFASHWQTGVPYAPPAAMSAEVALMLASWWHFIRMPFGDECG